jgi:FdhE protein
MLWPSARLRRARNVELQQRVAQTRRDHPESEAWLGLLEAALSESEEGGWDTAVPEPATDHLAKAPLLSHTRITLEGRVGRRWVATVLKRAGAVRSRAIDGLALLEAALRQDDVRVDALAQEAGAEIQMVRVAAQMAALPLLQACGRRLATHVPPSWWEGYCPVCAAWPVLAEYTGLERKRQMRCGRCGTGWMIPLLRCAFCDETDHDHLGYLTPEGEETRRVEVCHTCKGFVKAFTTVRGLPPWAILLEDFATVPLDIAALDRGYHRPDRPGWALEARITERGLHNPPSPPPSSTDLRQGEV